MMVKNSKGKIFYGIHMYPGVAEYRAPEGEPYRIFLNENTIRNMDPTFAGRPVFVEHVDEVDQDMNKLKNEADGWVVESFFNPTDGKHWVKLIVVTERAEKAIQSGMRLSNAYVPKGFGQGGQWNGVQYLKEVTEAEYEHLAIVREPRYEESVIMTPERFKKYNEEKLSELKKLSNSKDKKENINMGLNIFKRTKVENSLDLESHVVELPKSKKQFSIAEMVTELDKIQNMQGYANGDHMVKINDADEMTVNDLVKKYSDTMNELKAMKETKMDESEKGSEEGLEEEEGSMDVEGDKKNAEMELEEKKDKELEEAKDKKKNSNFNKLKNAHLNAQEEEPAKVTLMSDRVQKGRELF